MKNPLLEDFNTPFQTAPFDRIKETHFLPAVKEAIKSAKSEVEAITSQNDKPTFENTIVVLERSGQKLSIISSIFFNLNSANTNDNIQALAKDISPLLTEYSNDILLDAKLFQRVKSVFEQKDQLGLDTESQMLLEKIYKSFSRNGANLDESEKRKLREIDKELAKLKLQFGENVLAETNKFELVITSEADLEGLPDFALAPAKALAKAKDKPRAWIFTLQYPSYIPFMKYAKNRNLRKQMYMAQSSKAFKNDDLDNQENVRKIVKLRAERAKLLGYDTHAHFTLEERMAESPEKVLNFLNELLEYAKPAADKEIEELKAYAKKLDNLDQLERWDFSYYTEKLKKERFDFDDEILKPYFKLENVIEGIFTIAKKLFGLQFKESKTIPTYHPEVQAYEVLDSHNEHLAVFYADFFPRESKRNGAWMTSFRGQQKVEGQDQRPHISIVCNFTKPTEHTPSLLTFNEVTTFFHEFGHALHGILANGKYESLSGTNVYWDFVELPSQLLENWCYEAEALDLFAKHYETDKTIPQDLIEKVKKSAKFMEGYATVRQLSFGFLDMAWHAQKREEVRDISAFEQKAMAKTELFPEVEGTNMSCAFSHIFQGGYSAGYYSYKWAEVLDADAFELFKTKGIFNEDVANAYAHNILEKGGSEKPSVLYKRFRGQMPDVKALLRRAGLI